MKISQMINTYAADFIMLADTDDKKQSHLNLAVSAWNIAILPRPQRKKAIDEYLLSFKAHNPRSLGVKAVKQDLKQLIKQKNKMFPAISKPVVDAYIAKEDGVYCVYATSIDET